ncbi:MAG: hypothetical protein ACT4NV_19225 [Rhodoferax sp.]
MKYIKTEAGQLAFKQRSAQITPRQRSVFILFDGAKTVEQVLAATAGLGADMSDVEALAGHGFLAPAPAQAPSAAPGAKAPERPAAEPAAPSQGAAQGVDRFIQAKIMATQLSASIGLRGFMLNMLIEEAENLRDIEQLLPKLRSAVGAKACEPLEAWLKSA